MRASVERRFDVERMVDDYLALYRRVVELHRDARNGQRPAAEPEIAEELFRIGVNYWPARTGDELVVEFDLRRG